MKNRRSYIYLLLISISIGIFGAPNYSKTQKSLCQETYYTYSKHLEKQETIFAGPVIVWRYKKINNVLYKRQYNQSTKKWIGLWIRY